MLGRKTPFHIEPELLNLTRRVVGLLDSKPELHDSLRYFANKDSEYSLALPKGEVEKELHAHFMFGDVYKRLDVILVSAINKSQEKAIKYIVKGSQDWFAMGVGNKEGEIYFEFSNLGVFADVTDGFELSLRIADQSGPLPTTLDKFRIETVTDEGSRERAVGVYESTGFVVAYGEVVGTTSFKQPIEFQLPAGEVNHKTITGYVPDRFTLNDSGEGCGAFRHQFIGQPRLFTPLGLVDDKCIWETRRIGETVVLFNTDNPNEEISLHVPEETVAVAGHISKEGTPTIAVLTGSGELRLKRKYASGLEEKAVFSSVQEFMLVVGDTTMGELVYATYGEKP